MVKSREKIEINDTLTRAALRKTAGPVYFSRGEAYFDRDTVRSVREQDGMINATVHGTHRYKTSLWIEGGIIKGRCTCPLGQDREFCKHQVATGLAYIDQKKSTAKQGTSGKLITPKNIESYLSKQAVPDLVRIIMEQADLDDEFYALLRLRLATATAKPNISEMKLVLRQAIRIDDFISWRDTYAYTHGIDRVLKQLRTMLKPQHATDVIKLAEYALDLWEENIEAIDSSDGCMGMIRDDIHQLHLEACRIAKPDPIALAKRLCLRTINSGWDVFFDSYQVYREVFGGKGRARYRKIVEGEWSKLPHVGPGEDDPQRYGRAARLESMMLVFAEEDKDLNLAIRILSRDLSHPNDYLQIAERCQKERKYTPAREWAEKGLAAFPNEDGSRLRSFLADEYLRGRRPDDAMAMIWANFTGRTSLQTYQDLAKYARKLKRWDEWREKTFTHMRNGIKKQKAEYKREYGNKSQERQPAWRWMPEPPGHSLLVAVLLWEKRDEEAWAEAKKGDCSERYWLELAKGREKRCPKDAIEIYRRQVEPLIAQTSNPSYEEAVEFLGRIHGLMKRIGKVKEFRADLTRLKTEYKRKRNFIKYVERKRWGK